MIMYSVWVGGVEEVAYLMTLEKARLVAELYIENDYDDVFIEFIKQGA